MDLGAWWQARRWKALLELIDLLPAESRLNEARLNDPDEARLIVDARARAHARHGDSDDDEDTLQLAVSQFGPTEHLLVRLINLVAAVHSEGKATPLPAPKTYAGELARRESAQQQERDAAITITQVTPQFAYLFDEPDDQSGSNPTT